MTAELDLGWLTVADYADSHPGMSAEEIAHALTRRATRAQLLAWAVEDVRSTVEHHRRIQSRAAEERAEVPEPALARPSEAEPLRRQEASASAARRAKFERLLADPAQEQHGSSGWRERETLVEWERQDFRDWAGDRFAAWHEQARALAAEHGERDRFDSAWHPSGRLGYLIERWTEERAAQVRLETTRELLATVFALGDGTETTWGAATVAQHEQRVTMLAKNASGVIGTASRHKAAIRMITDAGVTCLADLATRTQPARGLDQGHEQLPRPPRVQLLGECTHAGPAAP
jgi:hypothetical protein